MRGNVVETLIGAMVILVAGFFLVYAYRSAGTSQVGGYEILAKFDRVDGLSIGGDVRLSGIKIGTITSQTLDPQTYRAVVRFTVNSAYKLPEDSSAKIASSSLLGGNYLSVEPGGSEENLNAGGEIKYTQGSINLLDLIAQAIFSATGTGSKDSKADGAANKGANAPMDDPAPAPPGSSSSPGPAEGGVIVPITPPPTPK